VIVDRLGELSAVDHRNRNLNTDNLLTRSPERQIESEQPRRHPAA